MKYFTRIRTIKNELFHHEDLIDKECETALPLRLLFMSLLTICDREGRFIWKPRSIKTACLPHDNFEINEALEHLIDLGLIATYNPYLQLQKKLIKGCEDEISISNKLKLVENKLIGVVVNFTKHQAINNREAQSELPEMIGINELRANNYMSYAESKKAKKEAYSNKKEAAKSTKASRVDNASSTNKEKEQEQEQEQEQEYIKTTTADNSAGVEEIFNFYIFMFQKQKTARLSKKRIELIQDSLKNYSIEQIQAVICGYAISDFWQGENKNHKKFDDLNYFLKDSENIERFLIDFSQDKSSYSIDQLDIINHMILLKNDFEVFKSAIVQGKTGE